MAAHAVAREYRLIGPSVEQPQYNMLERTKMEKDYLLLFRDYGMGTTIWSPLASGLLTGKYLQNKDTSQTRLGIEGMEWLKERTLDDAVKNEKIVELKKLADELGISLACLSIAWCIKNPNVSTAILGASKPEQLEENLKSLEVLPMLNTEILQRIDEILQNIPVLPQY
jgi:aryl-alcohol dehydrogenase-like predicted oxidoreductase